MSFSENAFLGDDILSFTKQYINNNKFYDLAIEINRFINIELMNINIEPCYNKDIFIIAITIRSLQSFNAIILLSKYGLENDAKVLLRALVEGIFNLGAIVNDENFFAEYLKKSDEQTLIIVNNLKRKSNRDFLTKELLDEVKNSNFQDLREIVESMDESYNKIWKIAKKAKMMHFYIYVYGVLSKYVHVNASVVKEYLDYDGDDFFVGFNNMPKSNDYNFILITANYVIIRMIEYINKYFKLDLDESIICFSDTLRKLDKQS